MKAVVLQALGGPEQLVYTDHPDPVPQPGQVLVRVRAAGLNFADVWSRRGLYPSGPQPPAVLGFEAAGEVVALGPGVTGLAPGQRVMGACRGGYAELAVANAAGLMPVPPGLTWPEAAAVPIQFLTAYHALVTFGHTAPGEWVLIPAAGGGVGTAAVQWARALGARVMALAGSDEKLARVRDLGAEAGGNYRREDWPRAVRAATGGSGVDVVLESVGGQILTECLHLLRPCGRLVMFGRAGGDLAPLDPWLLFTRNISVAGLWLSGLPAAQVAAGAEAVLAVLASGQVRPVVGHVFPLGQAAAAHRLLEGRESYGKVVLEP